MNIDIRIVDAVDGAKSIDPESIDSIVTSPPYWGLRSYLPDDHPDKTMELGTEATPEEYVSKLVAVFEALRPALKDTGTVWLNLGDSYTPGGRTWRASDKKAPVRAMSTRPQTPNIKPKSLIGIPWRVALALQAEGWILRSDIIWHKPNVMPESVRDRPTKSHEYLFMLTKSPRYYYDAEAIREPIAEASKSRAKYSRVGHAKDVYGDGITNLRNPATDEASRYREITGGMRNRRTVWNIATRPYKEAHYAVFPPVLIEPCIKAGSSEYGCCSECGAPWERVVDKGKLIGQGANTGQPAHLTPQGYARKGKSRAGVNEYSRTVGWEPTCSCPADIIPATVLDPFIGSGTTAEVAASLGRDCIGFDIDERNRALVYKRLGLESA